MLCSLSGRWTRVAVSKMHRRARKTRKCTIAVEEDVSESDRSPFPSVQRLGAVIARAFAGSSSFSLRTARDFYLAFARPYPEEGCAAGPTVNQTDLSAREPASVIFKSPTTCAPRYRRPGTDHLRLADVHVNATHAAKDAPTAEKCQALGRELRRTNCEEQLKSRATRAFKLSSPPAICTRLSDDRVTFLARLAIVRYRRCSFILGDQRFKKPGDPAWIVYSPLDFRPRKLHLRGAALIYLEVSLRFVRAGYALHIYVLDVDRVRCHAGIQDRARFIAAAHAS